jgi:hypothetical protein
MRRVVGVAIALALLLGPTALAQPSDAEKLDILWADYCERTAACAPDPTPIPTPSETPATPSSEPSATIPPTSSPEPSTPSPTPVPTPTATVAPTPTATPQPDTVHVEAQSWWSTEGIAVPSRVGHHIHVEALNFPAPGRIVDGIYNLRVKVVLHEHDGKTNTIRYSDGSDVIETTPFVLGPCADCSTELTLPVDFGRFTTGIREVRLTVNIPDEQPATAGDQRMFNSTGFPVCVRSCSSGERPQGLAFWEARGWYTDHEYQNARADVATVRPGQTINVRLGPGSGGHATVYSLVTVNPNMHGGDIGRVLLQRDGPYTGTVTIPADVKAGDKVALLAHDGKDGGVLILRVVP